MSIMKRILTGDEGRPGEARTTFADVWGRGADTFATGNASGRNVDNESAMQITAVFACVRILSDNVSTLPLDTFITWNNARKPFRPQPAWTQFQDTHLNKINLLSQMVVSILLAGDAFVAVYRDSGFRIIGLEVLDPTTVTVEWSNGDVVYKINNGAPLTRMDILHVPGMMMPGSLTGMSPVEYARESFGLSMAATEYGAAFFGGGALPGMTVEVPGELSPTGIRQLKRAWNDAHQGVGNSHKLAVLTEGAKFSKVTVDPEDAQFLQTRQFQVPDVARIYGVPPHLIGDATGSTSWGSGLAEQNSAFVQHTLRPLVERLEAGFDWLLRTEGLPKGTFIKLSVDGLLRGSNKDRLESYTKGIAAGFYTINEVRAWEDLPELEEPTPPPPPTPPSEEDKEDDEDQEPPA